MPEFLTVLPNPEAAARALQGRQVECLGPAAPPVLFMKDARTERRFWEFFTARIPNEHTRRAYYGAVCQFSAWCLRHGVDDLTRVEPIHVAAWVQDSGRMRSRPTVSSIWLPCGCCSTG